MLELGPTEQNIAKQAARSGMEIPDRIQKAPVLGLGLSFYLQAFFDLDADRNVGMSLGRIPWSVVLQYAAFYRLTEEQTDCLTYIIREMDTAYTKYREEQNGGHE